MPIGIRAPQPFLDVGFSLREDIIKLQHRMKSMRERWAGQKYDFYLIAHEPLYVFRKPAEGERLPPFRRSVKRWAGMPSL